MRFIESLCVALSTYSVIPVPHKVWTQGSTRYALCMFPAVGLLIGFAMWLWWVMSLALSISGVLFAAVAVAIPVLLTGGIHVDGFCDTVDALCSHRDRESKLQILKDPHIGAFALLYCALYLLVSFGVYVELYLTDALGVVCVGFVLSRAWSGLSCVYLHNARTSGMLYALTEHAHVRRQRAWLIVTLVVASGAMVWLHPLAGSVCALLLAALYMVYKRMVYRAFGGVTGDTAGFYLQVCELTILLGALIAEYIGRSI